MDTHEVIATFNHQDRVWTVAFSPDDKTIATASWDKTAHLYEVMKVDLIAEACRRLPRNLTAEEWKQYINSNLETYQKSCENLPVHPSVNLK
ncbi:WD40 repeat domain-containing protein [Hydrocoleum sp. CS-953]